MSTPVCSEYNIALQDLNHHAFTTSEQHKDSTAARMKRDLSDLEKLEQRLRSCNLFSADDNSFRNIVTGVIATHNVDVDDLFSGGQKIVDSLVGQSVFTWSFKRKYKAKTLGDASAVKISTEKSIDPALLFQRLLVISRAGDLSLLDVLDFELSPFLPSLFEANGVFRKPDKTQLARAIEDFANEQSDAAVTSDIPKTDSYVLDGGSLMHRVPWTKGSTYDAIAESYVDFTLLNYGKATVVFDGYQDTPSTKDVTHARRQQRHCPLISVTPEAVFRGTKDEFLSRGSNKQSLINMLSGKLRERGCNVINSQGDADCDIVHAAIAASVHGSTTLVGEDTDLLVLLLYYMSPDNNSLFFRSDNKARHQLRVYNINTLKLLLGQPLCSHLLFIHAFTGCDTTSRIFGVGKKGLFQKFVKEDKDILCCANVFESPGKTVDDIEESGYKAMALLFGGKHSENLTSLRHNMLKKKVVSATRFVHPERLPPTSSATKFHSLRCYYQMMCWCGEETNLNATDWGWRLENNIFKPIMCDKSRAPDCLLKVVHCNCQTACTMKRCTCRGYGLPCTAACGPCQTDSCENPFNEAVEPDPDSDDDDDVQNSDM